MVHPRKSLPLTHERLLEVLDYDPTSGFFLWRQTTSPRGLKGSQAGVLRPAGYRVITINRIAYLAHRLAWFYVYATWPEQWVDHINGCRDDNRIENLRDVPPAFNRHNTKQAGRNNKTGFLGVVKNETGRYVSRITYAGKKNHYLGVFDTPEEAHAAFMVAKQKYQKGAIRM